MWSSLAVHLPLERLHLRGHLAAGTSSNLPRYPGNFSKHFPRCYHPESNFSSKTTQVDPSGKSSLLGWRGGVDAEADCGHTNSLSMPSLDRSGRNNALCPTLLLSLSWSHEDGILELGW